MPTPQRDVRPTATYSVAKADQANLLEQFRRQRGAELPPGPYESWRVKLSDGASQATAIMPAAATPQVHHGLPLPSWRELKK